MKKLDPPSMTLEFTVIFAIVAEIFLCVSKIFERMFVMKKILTAAIFIFCDNCGAKFV